jgi:thiol-disulfide isomerase/thioredoxin
MGVIAIMLVAALTASTADAGVHDAPGHAHAPPAGATHTANDPDSGAGMIGRPTPPWSFTRWVGAPLSQEGLRGRVVLLRWWTEGCRFCEMTLPVLERLRREHGDRGLVVIGVFHPKPPREVSDAKITALARRLGFRGPIAFDREWQTLNRWWLDGHDERSWTSVSFLVDRQGRVRWVHGGGEYHPGDDPAHARCAAQYRALEAVLDDVLAEDATRGAAH